MLRLKSCIYTVRKGSCHYNLACYFSTNFSILTKKVKSDLEAWGMDYYLLIDGHICVCVSDASNPTHPKAGIQIDCFFDSVCSGQLLPFCASSVLEEVYASSHDLMANSSDSFHFFQGTVGSIQLYTHRSLYYLCLPLWTMCVYAVNSNYCLMDIFVGAV